MSIKNPVRLLKAEVARKIAAGEVIDRPNAIVRELMDNAIDSGADRITVETQGGGIEKVRVVDNGSGLTHEDLQNCARPHATSKIESDTDLLNLTTLGFRGEALASIAAVCRLAITSGGYKMRASITEDHIIEAAAPLEGTIVSAEGLFENFPARRQFLKRPASEGLMCKGTFIEKALPNPDKTFRLFQDGELKLDLPSGQTLSERFVSGMELKESPSLFSEISARAPGEEAEWSFKIVIGEPGVFRSNKKDIYIFVNGRRIQEYSLVQAIEYGSQGYFPNGSFPVAAAFITVKASCVDFNIHPAKKEVRFKDIASIHHGISSGVKAFFREYTNRTMKKAEEKYEAATSSQELFTPSFLAAEALSHTNSNSYTSSNSYENRSRYFGGVREETFLGNVKNPGWKGYSSKTFTPGNEKNYSKSQEERSFFSLPQVNEKNRENEQEDLFSDSIEENSSAKFVEEKLSEIIKRYNYKERKNEIAAEDSETKLSVQNTFVKNQEAQNSNSEKIEKQTEKARYIGYALGTFLIAERNDTLYLIDQHAVHERMIFDKIMQSPGSRQNLLLPYLIQTDSKKDDDYLLSIKDQLEKIGFDCNYDGKGNWKFTSVHERWTGTEEELKHLLLDNKVAPKDIIYSIAAMTSCKAAVKDGYILDQAAAEEIVQGALNLQDPHCPHGRPCYTTITKKNLFALVRRTDS